VKNGGNDKIEKNGSFQTSVLVVYWHDLFIYLFIFNCRDTTIENMAQPS